MTRALFNLSWRLLLVVSLAFGPWPPAAWSAFTSSTGTLEAAEAASDCHDTTDDRADADVPCEDGCCPDPACDPAHCLVLHASIVTGTTNSPVFAILGDSPFPMPTALAAGPPLPLPLRPPIA